MEHSHADHRGVHNRVLGKPEETAHQARAPPASPCSACLSECHLHGWPRVWGAPEWVLFLRTPSASAGLLQDQESMALLGCHGPADHCPHQAL